MLDYKNGKIYQVWSPNTDKVYIGSTAQPLHKRFGDEKKPSAKETCKQIIASGDARIELIEEYPCANKAELNRREGQVMRDMMREHTCVNRRIEGRTRAEYRDDNRERRTAWIREYNEKHKEWISLIKAEYQQRPEVKERRNVQAKEYYQRNQEKIAERAREKSRRPEVKAERAEYRQREDVKARRAAWAKEYRQRKKAEQQQTASA